MKERNYWGRGKGSGAGGQGPGIASYVRPVRELACTFVGSSNTTELAAVTRARDNREVAGGREGEGRPGASCTDKDLRHTALPQGGASKCLGTSTVSGDSHICGQIGSTPSQ